MYLARKYELGTLFVRLLLKTRPPFYIVFEPREGLAASKAKEVLFPSYFKTLSIGSAPKIEPATSRIVVKCSTD